MKTGREREKEDEVKHSKNILVPATFWRTQKFRNNFAKI